MSDGNDILFGGRIKAVAFHDVGDSVSGIVAKVPEQVQRYVYSETKDGHPMWWLDGKPVGLPAAAAKAQELRPCMDAVVTLNTDLRDPADKGDTGARRLFVKSLIMRKAIKEAVVAVGHQKIEVGGVLTVTYTGEEKPKKGGGARAAKVYEAEYKPPLSDPATDDDEESPF